MHLQLPLGLSQLSTEEHTLTHLLLLSWKPAMQMQRLSEMENSWFSRQAEEALIAGDEVEGAVVWQGLPKETRGMQVLERFTQPTRHRHLPFISIELEVLEQLVRLDEVDELVEFAGFEALGLLELVVELVPLCVLVELFVLFEELVELVALLDEIFVELVVFEAKELVFCICPVLFLLVLLELLFAVVFDDVDAFETVLLSTTGKQTSEVPFLKYPSLQTQLVPFTSTVCPNLLEHDLQQDISPFEVDRVPTGQLWTQLLLQTMEALHEAGQEQTCGRRQRYCRVKSMRLEEVTVNTQSESMTVYNCRPDPFCKLSEENPHTLTKVLGICCERSKEEDCWTVAKKVSPYT